MRRFIPLALIGLVVAGGAIGQSQFPKSLGPAGRIEPVEPMPTSVNAMLLSQQDGFRVAQLETTSPAVQWNGNDLHIVRLGQVLLTLDKSNALTATVSAGLLSFDEVDVTLHLAVFDSDGALLGTAHAVEHIDRVWLGVPVLMSRDVAFDFGVCRCFEDIHSISAAVTHGSILTPEQWMNDNSVSEDR